MFDPAVSSLTLTSAPRIPASQLILLRSLVDHLIASPPKNEALEESTMRKPFRVQADLFVALIRAAKLIGIGRQKKVVSLLQALPTAAVLTPAADPPASDRKKAGSVQSCRWKRRA
jgi:hypothetical protein